MRVLKIDRTVFDVGFDSDWNKLMNSYNAKGFEKMEFIGNLDLQNCIGFDGGNINLPIEMEIKGHLMLDGATIDSLPKKLIVNGVMSCTRTKIEFLPENLYVGGYLNVLRTKITKMPKKYYVKGTIYSDIYPSTGDF